MKSQYFSTEPCTVWCGASGEGDLWFSLPAGRQGLAPPKAGLARTIAGNILRPSERMRSNILRPRPKAEWRRTLSVLDSAACGGLARTILFRRRPRSNNNRAFTYIEVMIALAVVGILFIPMMQLFSHSLYSATVSGDLITAVNLCRWEMERVKNFNLTKAQIAKLGEIWTPPLAEPPWTLNGDKWRVLRLVKGAAEGGVVAGPLEVDVFSYRQDNLQKPLASLVTLIEDNVWVTREELQ